MRLTLLLILFHSGITDKLLHLLAFKYFASQAELQNNLNISLIRFGLSRLHLKVHHVALRKTF